MLLCESCNCRKCNFFFFNLQMSVFFWKFPARMKLIHRALFFFPLARDFSIILSYWSWWFWKVVYLFNFTFFHFFYFDVAVLAVIFLTHRNAVGPFQLETCCNWSGFRLRNATFCAQGTCESCRLPYTELCQLWGRNPWCHPENPFHFTLHWRKGAADADT